MGNIFSYENILAELRQVRERAELRQVRELTDDAIANWDGGCGFSDDEPAGYCSDSGSEFVFDARTDHDHYSDNVDNDFVDDSDSDSELP